MQSYRSRRWSIADIIAFNGSPRKEWNTATLLTKALQGAASKGARTELVHLYDLRYQGCISCFACKEKNGTGYGTCPVKDDLRPLLKRIRKAAALVFGSPLYLGNVSGEMQSFMERLIFPYMTYTDPPRSLFPGKVPTGFIFTMGITEEMMDRLGYRQRLIHRTRLLKTVFGSCDVLFSCDTYQFEDYSKVVAPRFDPEEKLRSRREVFPEDCRKAFELGVRLTRK